MNADSKILAKMGRYPVIKLSLKSAKQPIFLTAFKKIRESIIKEYRRHSYLWTSEVLPEVYRNELQALAIPASDKDLDTDKKIADEIGRYATALQILSDALKEYHNENVIILLDEYDVPLENAYYNGFYNEMVGFIRSLFESCLKTNDALELAVVTGCLRISKESIFTGLNNLEINSVRSKGFDEAFGFTEEETERMLCDYGMDDKIEEAKEWYDGYLFGDTEIYNPWSIIKYVSEVGVKKMLFHEPYWANTSSNLIIKDMIWHADDSMKKELDNLINGGTIEKRIHEDITYYDIHESEDNLWNFLFFTGYMKKVSERRDGDDIYLTMTIPNAEIESIYRNHISGWFKEQIKTTDRATLYKAVLEGDTDTIADYVSELLAKSISTFDSNEAFYHGCFLSLLMNIPNYAV